MIGHLFVQIHPHAACAPMHKHFTEHYHAASSEKQVPLVMAAVA
jgi:hypothetical protein